MQPFIDNYKTILQHKYAQFEGRAARTEFWSFVLVNFIISIIINIVSSIIFGYHSNGLSLSNLYSLAVFVPSIAVAARRLHDTNKSGWWQLLLIIPVIGWIILIVFYATDSMPGANKYGPSVKGVPPITPSGPTTTVPPIPPTAA